jgi:hypothetical protein
MFNEDVSAHSKFSTPLKKRRWKGSSKYSTRKALERSRMGRNLTRITKHGICATTRTLTFEDADLLKDGIDTEQPDIYAHEDVEIISETRLDIQDIEEEVESQPTLEVII